MRQLFGSLIVGLGLAISTASAAMAETVGVTFLLANDTYNVENDGPRGGFARLNAVVRPSGRRQARLSMRMRAT